MDTSHQRDEWPSGAPATPSGLEPTRLDEAVCAGAHRVASALTVPSGQRTRDGWLDLARDCQSLVNTLTAVQDTAIAQAARRESIWCEDGTLGETVHPPGRVSLDAADVVAPVIGASHPQAQRRVEQAVRLAAGLVPVQAGDRDLPQASGLGGLHQAMAAGQLDGYRAGVVAFELDGAPADVADAVVAALGEHLRDDASTLRRRTRALLHRISPDLVRERAKRARAATGLRRWVAEPGVDEWHGTFPSEDAATAWAAIDKLAHDLLAAGTCTSVEQARGKALTDLVTGHATVDVQVVLTVPADAGRVPAPADAGRPAAPGDDTTLDSPSSHAGPTPEGVARASSTSVTTQPSVTTADPSGSSHDDDLVQVHGARPSEPLLVRRGWLRDHLPTTSRRPPRRAKRASPPFVPCDPLTGARLDPGDHLATDAYRPGTELTALVKARDGRCRFPGCSVAARFCDLDHVRPWPVGPTAARNLLTLCRRHHRIKQRPGWSVHLAPDGTTTWADPTGRQRTTAPLDALALLVLACDPADGGCHPDPEGDPALRDTDGLGDDDGTRGRSRRADPELDGTPSGAPSGAVPAPWSALETHLELHLEHHPHADREQHLWLPPTHRRCTSAAELRAGFARRRARAPLPDAPPF